MNKKVIVLITIIFTGCSFPKMPQSTGEFRNIAATNSSLQTTRVTIKRSFESISTDLQAKVNNCFNYDSTWSRSEGGMVRGSFTEKYRTRIINNSKKLEIAIQAEPMGNRIGPTMPEGGFYRMVIDLNEVNNNTSNLVIYSARWEDVTNAITDWAKGLNTKCPIN